MEEYATRQWTMSLPSKVEFGAGCLNKLKDHLNGYHKAMLVTGRSAMKKAGVTDRVVGLIEAAGLKCVLFDDISPDPDCTEIDHAAEIAREFAADVIIGCGGGSAMDAAKAIAVMAVHPGSVMDYRVNGPCRPSAATLPIVAISTTSGTGSHLGRAAVMSNRSQSIKRAIVSYYIFPRVGFCDPEILASMPPDVTAATGFDAFSHALEGYLAVPGDPMGNLCALEAMRIILQTLPDAVRNGDDLELRAAMSWADTLAGVPLASNGITTPHVFAMLLGGRYGVTHGCALASVTVAWLKHVRTGAAGKLASIAYALGGSPSMSPDTAAQWLIGKVEMLIDTIGMNKGICAQGVPHREFQSIVTDAQANFVARLDVDPVPPDANVLSTILTRSK